jgi:hypothetical protein
MNTHAFTFGRRLRHRPFRTTPPIGEPRERPPEAPVSSEHGLAAIARDAGLRTPDTVATPEMAEQTGLSIGVLRWVPVYVIGLAVILAGGIGLVVLTVL